MKSKKILRKLYEVLILHPKWNFRLPRPKEGDNFGWWFWIASSSIGLVYGLLLLLLLFSLLIYREYNPLHFAILFIFFPLFILFPLSFIYGIHIKAWWYVIAVFIFLIFWLYIWFSVDIIPETVQYLIERV